MKAPIYSSLAAIALLTVLMLAYGFWSADSTEPPISIEPQFRPAPEIPPVELERRIEARLEDDDVPLDDYAM